MASVFTILVTYLAVWAIICIAWWAFRGERFGISGPPFYLMYRTSRLNNWIARIAAWRPMFWRTVWNMGIVTGVGSMVFIFYYLALNVVNLFVKSPQAVSVQPIVPVPGLFVSFQTFPYLVFALSLVVITHELSHGIASLGERVPLKSTGAFFGHVLMGGFVEPDEEKLNQAGEVTKLRVFAAGSYTNLVLGLLCIVLLSNFAATMAPFYTVSSSGVSVGSVPTNLPAYSSGIQAGDIVTAINGTKISTTTDIMQFMRSVKPGQEVLLGTQRGTFPVKTAVDPTNSSHALIGIGGLTDLIVYNPKFPFLSPDFPNMLVHAEYWSSIVLTSVALINMLPMAPFDGDKFLASALTLLGVKRTKEIRTIASAAGYGILLLNFGLSLLRFGFVRF
ncbi:MAG: site-2 protease family protein [Candidatus Bathyarchaeia archaeon]